MTSRVIALACAVSLTAVLYAHREHCHASQALRDADDRLGDAADIYLACALEQADSRALVAEWQTDLIAQANGDVG
jgi:hypothetical protein